MLHYVREFISPLSIKIFFIAGVFWLAHTRVRAIERIIAMIIDRKNHLLATF
jgi:hypothetical protein